jgi:hypothetical protein
MWRHSGTRSSGVRRGRRPTSYGPGPDRIRLTFSYATREYQAEQAVVHHAIARKTGRPCLVLADLAGEKFRLTAAPCCRSLPSTRLARVASYVPRTAGGESGPGLAIQAAGFLSGG